MTWPQVCARRLSRHSLLAPGADLVSVAGALCGVHAQVMSAAELSLGLRVGGVTRVDVRTALWVDRSLVKTYGPRGTVHLFPAGDWGRWSAALAIAHRPPSMPATIRLRDEQTDAVIDAISVALAEADLTIDELDERVAALTGPWAGERVVPGFGGMSPRWRQAMTPAAYRGALCYGPQRGSKVTYADPARQIPGHVPVDWLADGPAALAEVTLRYLLTYGPATPHQFAQWFALGRRAATDLFASLSDRLSPVEVDGEPAWLPADDEGGSGGDGSGSDGSDGNGGDRDTTGGLRLLPYFDAYSVGCHPRDLVFPGAAGLRAITHGQAGTVAVVLIDGVVAGVWHQRRSGRRIAITVEPFGKLTLRQRRDLSAEVDRIGEILEGTPTLTVGPVTARSHL